MNVKLISNETLLTPTTGQYFKFELDLTTELYKLTKLKVDYLIFKFRSIGHPQKKVPNH